VPKLSAVSAILHLSGPNSLTDDEKSCKEGDKQHQAVADSELDQRKHVGSLVAPRVRLRERLLVVGRPH